MCPQGTDRAGGHGGRAPSSSPSGPSAPLLLRQRGGAAGPDAVPGPGEGGDQRRGQQGGKLREEGPSERDLHEDRQQVDHEDEERPDVRQGGPEAEEAGAGRERVSEERDREAER